jgi:hypothetical protein
MAEFTQYFTLDRFSDRITTMPDVTPIYNWPIPEDTDLVKDGAEAIRDLAGAIETTVDSSPVGLVHIDTVSASAVSALNIDNVFSSTYDNYKMIIVGSFVTAGPLRYRLRVAGSDATDSNYVSQGIIGDGTGVSGFRATAQTSGVLGDFGITANRNISSSDITSPNLATPTTFIGHTENDRTASMINLNGSAYTPSTAFTGITIFPNTGNMSITVSIFGYAKV